MITFIQFLITGLRLGSVYALIALGYTMVYGIIKLINFAHGDFIMVGGYTLFFTIPLLMGMGLPGWLAVIPAIVICACVGVLVELLAYRPVRRTGNSLTCLITAIAMSFVLENLAQAIPAIGPDPRVPYTLFADTISVGGVSISHATIITIAVSAVIMVALYLFTQRARSGCARRRWRRGCTPPTLPAAPPPWAPPWASTPSWRRCWGASAPCRGPCWEDC